MVSLDNTLPTDPVIDESVLILYKDPDIAWSGPISLSVRIEPPNSLICKKSEGIPKQFIRALNPLSVPLAFKR